MGLSFTALADHVLAIAAFKVVGLMFVTARHPVVISRALCNLLPQPQHVFALSGLAHRLFASQKVLPARLLGIPLINPLKLERRHGASICGRTSQAVERYGDLRRGPGEGRAGR